MLTINTNEISNSRNGAKSESRKDLESLVPVTPNLDGLTGSEKPREEEKAVNAIFIQEEAKKAYSSASANLNGVYNDRHFITRSYQDGFLVICIEGESPRKRS